MKTLFLIVALSALAYVSATCPNLCNGHGTCEANDRCVCFSNWQGADCSERVCSYGLAWVDAPSATNTAHWYAECSNKGVCDRKTGLCECFPGYEGKGCRRSTCPNDCSGHGTCYFINQLKAAATDPTGRKVEVDYGTLANTRQDKIWYDNWDANKITGCQCDPYYEGADCSQRMCPRGDNRLTTGSTNAAGQIEAKDQGATYQEIFIGQGTAAAALGGEFTLTFKDLYGGVWETDTIQLDSDGDATGTFFTPANIATRIKEELENLPNDVIESVDVTSIPCGVGLSTTALAACTGNDAAVTTTNMCATDGGGTPVTGDVPNGRLGGGYLGFTTLSGITWFLEDTAGTVTTQVAGDYGWHGQCLDFLIKFTGDQNVGVQNLIEVNIRGCDVDGCAPRYKGLADADHSTGAAAIVAGVADVTTYVDSGSNKLMHKERAVCSEHGLCDTETGLCNCFSGYYDEDCNKQTVLV
jgi:hypothetical protein